MRVLMLGANHRTADLAVRERLAVADERQAQLLAHLRGAWPAAEAVVLSTCNRMELYLARPATQPPSADELRAAVAAFCELDPAQLLAATIHRENEQAVAHLFRVCAGLESMVLGEPQILGQVRRAYEHAHRHEAVGPVLHKVFQTALATGKQVRHETGIDAGRTSIGSIAADFARNIFDTFDDKTVLGIGAGEMAKVALRHFNELKPHAMWIINRTRSRGESVAQALALDGPRRGVRSYDDLDTLLIEADIVITSTGAPHAIITAERFRTLVRRRRGRPLFVIDLAIPRDVEPAVGALSNVYLYNLDDLQQVVEQTHTARCEIAARCEGRLADAVRRCMAEIQHRDLGRLIRELRGKLFELGEAEQARTLHADGDGQAQALEEYTHRLIHKILHLPLSQIDAQNPDAPLAFYSAALRRLFQLEPEEADEAADAPDAPEAERAANGSPDKPITPNNAPRTPRTPNDLSESSLRR